MSLSTNLEKESTQQPTCKGRFYRFLDAAFIGKGGRIVCTKELRPLKSISCPGCETCWPDEGCISELIADTPLTAIEFDPALTSNDIAQLVLVVDSYDREMGYIEDYHYLAVPVTTPVEKVSAKQPHQA